MKLKAYRKMTGQGVDDAARQIGVSPTCWRYWENGAKIPSRERMGKIFEWSLGHVTPLDFYDLGSPGGSAVAPAAGETPGGDPPAPPAADPGRFCASHPGAAAPVWPGDPNMTGPVSGRPEKFSGDAGPPDGGAE